MSGAWSRSFHVLCESVSDKTLLVFQHKDQETLVGWVEGLFTLWVDLLMGRGDSAGPVQGFGIF